MNSFDWKICALVAMLGWGLWGFFGKVAAQKIPTGNLMLLSLMGSSAIVLIFVPFLTKGFSFHPREVCYLCAVGSGIVATMASLFFYFALAKGEATSVVVISSLYPIVTFILAAIFLSESFTIKKIAGMALAIAGIILLSI